jgi:hypothetical protein
MNALRSVLAGVLVVLAAGTSSGPVAGDTCVLEMPRAVSDASDLVFSAVFVGRQPASFNSDTTVSAYQVENLLVGADLNARLPDGIRLTPGERATFVDGCAPLRHLGSGADYLIATGNPGSLTSMETVAWRILPGERVELVRQYGSMGMDPRFAQPQTVAQVVSLVTSESELPPTDTVAASTGEPWEWPLILIGASLVVFAWRGRRLQRRPPRHRNPLSQPEAGLTGSALPWSIS